MDKNRYLGQFDRSLRWTRRILKGCVVWGLGSAVWWIALAVFFYFYNPAMEQGSGYLAVVNSVFGLLATIWYRQFLRDSRLFRAMEQALDDMADSADNGQESAFDSAIDQFQAAKSELEGKRNR